MKGKAIQIVASKLLISEKIVESVYREYWEAIKKVIEELSLKDDLTEEEFSKLRTTVSIPYLGKLSCTYKRYMNIKNKYSKNKKDDKHKKG